MEHLALTNYLNECRNAYYNESRPLISDALYDSLFDKLKAAEEKSGIIYSSSPTQTVGYEAMSSLDKVQHKIPLLSLAKTKQIEDICSFVKDKSCLFMLKYDGLTVELIYDKGVLIQASTRGNGYEGEDITHNARTFKNIPLKIPYDGFLRLVGEAIIHTDDFEVINKNLNPGEKPYATPRNLAAGSVRQLDSLICSKRNVYFMLWDVLEGFDTLSTRGTKIAACHNCGFELPDYLYIDDYLCVDNGTSIIKTYADELKQIAHDKNIPIDGLVIKYNDIAYANSLGGTSHHNNDGLAFKFEDEVAKTNLIDIEWSIGRTGQLTPVGIFDPVELDGTTVSRASLHNLSIIREILGVPFVGQEIEVVKQNMIIPQIISATKIENIPEDKMISVPTRCPFCDCDLLTEKINSTEVLKCVNPTCSGNQLKTFSHFVSKQCLDIVGLSEASLQKLIEYGFLNDLPDIFELYKHRNEIAQIEGFGEKSVDKLLESIDKAKNTTLDRFIVSLGIPGVGKTAAKDMANYVNGNPEKFNELVLCNFDWSSLDNFGTVTSAEIIKWFNYDKNKALYERIRKCLIFEAKCNTIRSRRLDGKTVCVTGTLVNYTRDSITEALENAGAKVVNSVSKKTDYLVAGEKAGSKLQKAKDIGVKIISEQELAEMI